MPLIGLHVAAEAARDGPHAARVERVEQHGVRHEAGDPPVAVEKRVNPGEPVMRGRERYDGVRRAALLIRPGEVLEKARHRPGADRNVLPDPEIAGPQGTGLDQNALAALDRLIETMDASSTWPGDAAEGQRGRAGSSRVVALPDNWLASQDLDEAQRAQVAAAEQSVADVAETFGALVDQGLTARIGLSNHPAWYAAAANVHAQQRGSAGFSALQLRESYLHPRPDTPVEGEDHPHGMMTIESKDLAERCGLDLWAYTPLLTGAYPLDRLGEALAATRDKPGGFVKAWVAL